MRYIEIPEPVAIKLRNGERLRQTITDPKTGQPTAGDVMEPLSFFDYAEVWFTFNVQGKPSLNEGDFRKRQQAAKIVTSLDEVKLTHAKVWSLEDADYDRLDPIVNEAVMFGSIVFEAQCAPFIEAFKNAKKSYPAHLAPPKSKKKEKS